MFGLLFKSENGEWMCKHTRPINNFDYEVAILPLHPDDYALAELKSGYVQFEVENIAIGTSEFDVMDCDVARIITNKA
jgi:hypothetical protein